MRKVKASIRMISQMRAPSPARCLVCFGLGWVCENHSNRAWSDEFGCQCGAGMPCECVRADGLEEPDVSGVMIINPLTKS
jgi:hypothetical protein